MFRVNCLDSLDRTSVVQQAVSKIVVHKQLMSLKILEQTEPIDEQNKYIFYGLYSFQKTFNTLWGNICDSISYQYAGTDALKVFFYLFFFLIIFFSFFFLFNNFFIYFFFQKKKGDFVKTGTRDVLGQINDSINSMGRYFEKIFTSEIKQVKIKK